jgi:hypothetical protein
LLEALKVKDPAATAAAAGSAGKKQQRQSAGKQQQRGEDMESVKDIKSQEMILEEAMMQGSQSQGQIVGGGQEIEHEGDEIQEDDEEGAEYLDDQHN